MERPKREKKSRVDQSALDALDAARSGVGKRVAQVQVRKKLAIPPSTPRPCSEIELDDCTMLAYMIFTD
jgi:hypothetical protein